MEKNERQLKIYTSKKGVDAFEKAFAKEIEKFKKQKGDEQRR